jgi:hypothetical protein
MAGCAHGVDMDEAETMRQPKLMAVGQHGNEINSTVTYEAHWGSL